MKKLKNHLNSALKDITPNVFDNIASSVKNVNFKENDTMKTQPIKKRKLLPISVAACLTLATVGLGSYFYSYNYLADTTIGIEVNPSVEIQISHANKITSVKALNPDGEIVLGDMKLKGVDLSVGVNAITGSMLTNGFLKDIDDVILVNVENDDDDRAMQIRQNINEYIQTSFTDTDSSVTIIDRTTSSADDEIQVFADKHNISYSKAMYIFETYENNPSVSKDELAYWSIDEIKAHFIDDDKDDKNDTNAQVEVSKYISTAKAKEIALNLVGLSKVSNYQIELDDHKYEIEFENGNTEYDIVINAYTGAVIHSEKDVDDDIVSNSNSNNSSSNTTTSKVDKDDDDDDNDDNVVSQAESKKYISTAKAKEIALKLVGLSKVSNYQIELDDHKYEIEFENGNTEYDIVINAYTGAVIHSEKDVDDDIVNSSSNSNNSSSNTTTSKVDKDDDDDDNDDNVVSQAESKKYISTPKAKEIALKLVGLSKVSNYQIELDDHKYEIEFKNGNTEYDIVINAYTGAVIHSEKDVDDDIVNSSSSNTTNSSNSNSSSNNNVVSQSESKKYISTAKAKEIALKLVGLSKVSNYEIELDDHKYEIEFKNGNTEYDIVINAYTGAVIHSEKDVDDDIISSSSNNNTTSSSNSSSSSSTSNSSSNSSSSSSSSSTSTNNKVDKDTVSNNNKPDDDDDDRYDDDDDDDDDDDHDDDDDDDDDDD